MGGGLHVERKGLRMGSEPMRVVSEWYRNVVSRTVCGVPCGVNRQFHQKLNPQEPTGLAQWSVSTARLLLVM